MFFKNIFVNLIGRVWSVLSIFLFIPIYISILGFENYSIIGFTFIVSGVLTIFDSGLTATLSREFARSDQKFEIKLKIFNSLESLYFIIIAIVISLVIMASDYLSLKFINSKIYKPSEVSLFLKYFSFDIGFQLLLRFYYGGFLGLDKQILANVLQFAWSIFRNALVLIVIYFFPTLNFFFLWQSLCTFIFAILFGVVLRKILFRNFKISFHKIDKKVFSKVRGFASGMLILSLIAAINYQLDKVIITKLLPIEILGYYTVAVSLASGINILAYPISISTLPHMTNYFSSGNIVDAKRLFDKSFQILTFLIFTALALFIFFGKQLIWIWTGDLNLSQKASIYITPISIGFSSISLAILPFNIAVANGYTKLNNMLGLFNLVISIPFSYYFTVSYGAIGAAYVFCFTQIVLNLTFIYFIEKKYFIENSRLKKKIKSILIPFIVTFSITYIFTLFQFYINQVEF